MESLEDRAQRVYNKLNSFDSGYTIWYFVDMVTEKSENVSSATLGESKPPWRKVVAPSGNVSVERDGFDDKRCYQIFLGYGFMRVPLSLFAENEDLAAEEIISEYTIRRRSRDEASRRTRDNK
jgi:hypothetical protein